MRFIGKVGNRSSLLQGGEEAISGQQLVIETQTGKFVLQREGSRVKLAPTVRGYVSSKIRLILLQFYHPQLR